MSHPIIILGAGASKDYVQEKLRSRIGLKHYDLPLSNELCDFNFLQKSERKFIDFAQTITSELGNAVARGDGFEKYLTMFKGRYSGDKQIQKELVAFEFYLHRLFWNLSNPSEREPEINNYKTLVNKLRLFIRDKKQPCTILTFNYDILIEKELDISKELSSFITSELSLVKLHGSSDWCYKFSIDENINKHNVFDYYMKNVPMSDYFRSEESIYPYRCDNRYYLPSDNTILYPAIALPLNDKSGFVCPKKHKEKTRQAINETDRILIIGWKGSDDYLLKMIEKEAKKNISVTIVKRKTSSDKAYIENRINKIPQVNKVIFSDRQGFSDYMVSGQIDNFLEI